MNDVGGSQIIHQLHNYVYRGLMHLISCARSTLTPISQSINSGCILSADVLEMVCCGSGIDLLGEWFHVVAPCVMALVQMRGHMLWQAVCIVCTTCLREAFNLIATLHIGFHTALPCI